ncbi:NAD-dependent DNA ligase LigA [Pelagicoccus albus]|uniref:DNA ligase n=1 Tax=Pelagicoccus albus TaxID=415222 RepID=A0A7X1E911_9BACT|nr:NAD-dependent DNA ligase LigA [Pelagicoccus albus]
MPILSIQDRIEALKAEIAYHDELYYQKATPEISDAEYDLLKEKLRSLEQLYSEELTVDTIGDDRQAGVNESKHGAPMLSLEKAYSKSELRDFYDKVVGSSRGEEVSLLVEPKVDGVAVSLVYENGVFARALSRGNGKVGEDVSQAVMEIEGLPLNLAGDIIPRRIELRGEVYLSFEDFRKVNEARLRSGEKPFSHPRNLAAGSLKLKDVEKIRKRDLSLVVFGLGDFSPIHLRPSTQWEFYKLLEKWGFETLQPVVQVSGYESLAEAVELSQSERLMYPFPTDGTVIKVSSFGQQERLGVSRYAPNWALAYKSVGSMHRTRLLEIIPQVGKTGLVTPVAHLEEIEIGGSRVSRASLHSFRFVEEKDLREGDFVFVKKAGEIIPQVTGVDLASRSPSSPYWQAPEYCSACGSKFVRKEGQVKVYCPDVSCPERLKQRLLHFVSKSAMDIEGWGEATLSELVKTGKLASISDLFVLQDEDLVQLPHLSDESAARMMESLEKCQERSFARLVYGLAIPEIGLVRSGKVASALGDLAHFAEWAEQGCPSGDLELKQRTQRALQQHFDSPVFRKEILALFDLGLGNGISETKDFSDTSNISGKVFVFTGRLESFSRTEALALVREKGGLTRSNISRKCDYLVVGSDLGSKVKAARELGITTIDEAEFLALLSP